MDRIVNNMVDFVPIWVFGPNHINTFFVYWTESTASSPVEISISPKMWATYWRDHSFFLSPFVSLSLSLCFVFTYLLSPGSRSRVWKMNHVAKDCCVWQKELPSDPLVLTLPPVLGSVPTCAGKWLSCPLVPSLSAGFGYCLTFIPTVTLLAQYFSRRRALVTSFASTGECVAIFAFAPGRWLFDLIKDHAWLAEALLTLAIIHFQAKYFWSSEIKMAQSFKSFVAEQTYLDKKNTNYLC